MWALNIFLISHLQFIFTEEVQGDSNLRSDKVKIVVVPITGAREKGSKNNALDQKLAILSGLVQFLMILVLICLLISLAGLLRWCMY